MMIEFWIQLIVVLVCIFIGARSGGAGIGVAGGLGLVVLVLLFHMRPASPPIDVLLIISAVITCVAFLQSAGGLDLLVHLAKKLLRKHPSQITFIGPLVCYCFTLFCGTAYVAFAVYPVIAEVAIKARVRPERPLSMSVIAAQSGITGSPMSAATAAMIGLLAAFGVTPLKLMLVCIPACLIGVLVGCFSMFKYGKELKDDPEFQRRIASGEFTDAEVPEATDEAPVFTQTAKYAVAIFTLGIITVVSFGSLHQFLPEWDINGKVTRLSIPHMIQMVMLATACLIMLFGNAKPGKAVSGSVFSAGMTGVISVFGISWLTGTFFNAYTPLFVGAFSELLQQMPFLFALALFFVSAALFSQGATVMALMPLGLAIGISPAILVAMFPAVSGYFLIPAGASIIGCISFDRTGSTRIGKYVINHSYMLPGLVTTITSVAVGYFLSQIVF